LITLAQAADDGYDARLCQGRVLLVKTVCLVVLVGLSAPAFAQEIASSPQGADVDEVVVPGRRPANLRVEIERLEASVYDRFNALNSDDDFDIHCLEQAPTGSNIPLRKCAPNFVIEAESNAASRMLSDGRAGAGNNNSPAEHTMLMEEKSRALTAEMQRLAREDEQLLRDLVRLDELKQLQSSDQQRR
jgi:hypothetical protein